MNNIKISFRYEFNEPNHWYYVYFNTDEISHCLEISSPTEITYLTKELIFIDDTDAHIIPAEFDKPTATTIWNYLQLQKGFKKTTGYTSRKLKAVWTPQALKDLEALHFDDDTPPTIQTNTPIQF